MPAALKAPLFGALLLAGACAAPTGDGEGQAARPAEAAPHEDARFLVRRDGEVYRANVRYVDMIDKSVIAVRRGRGDAGEDWPVMEIEAGATAPGDVPFGAESWRPVALEICEAVLREAAVCPPGRELALIREKGGEVRTMYRDPRQAWVIFAACRTSRES